MWLATGEGFRFHVACPFLSARLSPQFLHARCSAMRTTTTLMTFSEMSKSPPPKKLFELTEAVAPLFELLEKHPEIARRPELQESWGQLADAIRKITANSSADEVLEEG